MATLKQTDRLMQFSSPLGKDVLLMESLDGAEGISRLFEFHVDLLATVDTKIEFKSIVGSKVTVAIALNDAQGSRWINGIVASFEQCAGDEEFDLYRARIVPSMWQLTLSSNCRVFQDKTVLEIAKRVFADHGLSVSDQTNKSYEKLEYCTQYSESDFHFVSRLLEESGIFYWFEHSDQDNKIMLGDSRNAYQDCPLSSSFPYALNKKGAEGAYGARVIELSATATMVSGRHTTTEYNFRHYQAEKKQKDSSIAFGKNHFDSYLYPAGEEGYLKDADTKSSTKLESLFLDTRVLASDSMAEVFRGSGNARSLCAGYAFSLTDHPRSEWNKKYLLTAVTHHANQVPPYRAVDKSPVSGYSNHFAAVLSTTAYQPERTVAKPRIYGPQTAFVVAPNGEEMYIDKYGRVCIQFFWDRERNPPNNVDNTWVRVAQSWGGNGWGTYFWPRLKDEVVIQFLNGDPDNPVIVGSVYNGVNMPKYTLPEHSTRSGLITRSSKGGSAQNANELRFEDKKGSEQIFLNAEKDMDQRTENDHRRFVGFNDSLIVKNNQNEKIEADYNREIGNNLVEKVDTNAEIEIGVDLVEKIGNNYSENVGNNHAEKVGMNYALDAGMQVYIKGGMTVVIESGMELCLKGAGGFITIGPAGIAISGTMVMINSGGAPVSGTPGTVTSPSAPKAPDEADDGTKGGAM
jgi:type VI secretion system secreted protein VgrG